MTKKKRLIIIFSALAVFVALIIINSVVFSIRRVTANSLNTFTGECQETRDTNAIIEEHHGIRMGSSIFMLNENRTRERVTQNVIYQQDFLNIEIRRLERIFPNRVVVHYVIIRPYFYIQVGNRVKTFANNGALTHIDNDVQSARARGAIRLYIRGELESLDIGQQFETTVDADRTRFLAVISALEQLIYHHQLRSELEYINIASPQAIFARVAPNPGVRFEINSVANFTAHLQIALSTYRYFLAHELLEYRIRATSGTLFTFVDNSGIIRVAHRPHVE